MASGAVTVWGRANSLNVQKVLWALQELDVAYERFDAGGSFGGLDTPEFQALNPNRRIPVIRDGDLVLWESNAIVRYLAARYGRGKLAPSDEGRFAVADQWMDWMQTTLSPDFTGVFFQVVRLPSGRRDGAVLNRHLANLAGHYRLLEEQLKHREWLAGDAFSMGDIPAGSTLYRFFTMEIERPALPAVEEWYRRLQTRPAYRATVMTSYDALRARD